MGDTSGQYALLGLVGVPMLICVGSLGTLDHRGQPCGDPRTFRSIDGHGWSCCTFHSRRAVDLDRLHLALLVTHRDLQVVCYSATALRRPSFI